MADLNIIPAFTREQVEWLDKAFPECTNTTATANELFINLGQRRVVKRIKSIYDDKVREVAKKL